MVTVKITAGTLIKGVPVKAGDVVDVDIADANILIGYGKAERYEDPRKKAEEEEAKRIAEEEEAKRIAEEEEAKRIAEEEKNKKKGGKKK